jgi:uncharacterized protein Usg
METRTARRTQDLEKQLKGYPLATAEITYRMPDAPAILQLFVWQLYDLAPHYPALHEFLAFWENNLDRPLHSVRVESGQLLQPPRWRHQQGSHELH